MSGRSRKRASASTEEAPPVLAPLSTRSGGREPPLPAVSSLRSPSPTQAKRLKRVSTTTPEALPVAAEAPALPASGITEYEQLRLARIAENQARLAQLNVPSLAKAVAPVPAKPTKQRGLASRRERAKSSDEPVQPRMSLRSRGVAPEAKYAAGIDSEENGRISLVHGGNVAAAPAESRAPRPVGTLSFASTNGTPGSDAAFLSSLRCAAPLPSSHAVPTASALAALRLREEGVAKVTLKGVTHLCFQPRSDALLLASADKDGHIALWRADRPSGAEQEKGAAEEGDDDGVLLLKPHGQYVSGLVWSSRGDKLLSVSYDGSLRSLDVARGESLELWAAPGDEFSAMDATAETAYLGDNEGRLRGIDARSGAVALAPVRVHNKKVNTISVRDHSLATACGDATVCVWDVRRLGSNATPLLSLAHGKSCQSAYFAPSGAKRVLSTSYDDSVSVWSDKGERMRVKHDNQTGRWLLPLRAVWAPCGTAFVVGSMKRDTELFSAADGRCIAQHSDALLTAVPSRHACHPSRPIIAAGTASGRAHLWGFLQN